MVKLRIGILLLLVACVGTGCMFPDFDPRIEDSESLEDYSATVTISQFAGESQAEATARFTDARGFDADLDERAVVSLGDRDLFPTATRGLYAATVSAAETYTLTVRDPTRGVQNTEIVRPADFTITEPGDGEPASLSGFTLRWSGADADLDVSITLSEQIFDEDKRRTFDASPDTGSREFSAEDLSIFQQGADLQITVTKTRRRMSINGFGSGVFTSELAQTTFALPAP